MLLSIIAAFAKDKDGARVIGKEGRLPWHFPHDLERFKEYTLDNTIIMGRKTHEAIGRVLPRRDNIIITHQPDYSVLGAYIFKDLDEAIEFSKTRCSEAFIIGGQQLYERTIARVDRLYLTSFNIPDIEGDAYFPPYNEDNFRLLHIENTAIGGDCFRILERRYFSPRQMSGIEPVPTRSSPTSTTGMPGDTI